MTVCCMKGCHSISRKHDQEKCDQITIHTFPADETWKEKWIKAVRNNRNDVEWLPSKFSVICSLHFEKNDIYNTKLGYRRIKKKAIPKKIRLVNSEWCQGMETSSSSTNPKSSTLGLNIELSNIKEEGETAGIFGDTPDKLTEDISNCQDEINDSDLDSVYDTPSEHKLRKQARRYKSLYKIHARKIKTLNQKVRRLKKQIASLKTVLKDFKTSNKKKTVTNSNIHFKM